MKLLRMPLTTHSASHRSPVAVMHSITFAARRHARKHGRTTAAVQITREMGQPVGSCRCGSALSGRRSQSAPSSWRLEPGRSPAARARTAAPAAPSSPLPCSCAGSARPVQGALNQCQIEGTQGIRVVKRIPGCHKRMAESSCMTPVGGMQGMAGAPRTARNASGVESSPDSCI